MPAERYFCQQTLETSKAVLLADQEFHHLAHVMRAKVGDQVEVVNGLGTLASAQVVQLSKKGASLLITSVTHEPKQAFDVVLAQAIPRINRLDFILEKGTELGMTELWLFPGERSERKEFSANQLDRFAGILIASMKQCGRLWLPKINLVDRLRDWESLTYPSFYGCLDPGCMHLIRAWESDPPKRGAIVLIGPESGFSEAEDSKMKSLGAHGVKLHPNILRTDTASLAALSFISYQMHKG